MQVLVGLIITANKIEGTGELKSQGANGGYALGIQLAAVPVGAVVLVEDRLRLCFFHPRQTGQ